MSTTPDAFLAELPFGLTSPAALGSIAAIAHHVSSVLGQSRASAFSDVDEACPPAVRDAIYSLDDDACTPDLLGVAWEHLLAPADRRVQGAHFTPATVADLVVEIAFASSAEAPDPATCTVWDPTAGGGAFLLASARALDAVGATLDGETPQTVQERRAAIVANCFATDVDPVALRVCDAALELWSGGQARPTVAVGNALLDLANEWPTNFSYVLGNPPFLGQLTSDTARGAEEFAQLKERFGDLASGYVDQAALFVELGLRSVQAGGTVALILPQSVLGAADATRIRESASSVSDLATLWVDDVGVFAAAVEVVAAVFTARDPTRAISDTASGSSTAPMTAVRVGNSAPIHVHTPSPKSWAPLLAAAQGIPEVTSCSTGSVVRDIASVTAGFRQHFYGISDAVIDSESFELGAEPVAGTAHLITSGAIDPLANSWGTRPVKFAGQKWAAPVLVLDKISNRAVRDWFAQRMVPKLLLASQTPVLEAVVDLAGTLVPSVPVISVEPRDADVLWHLAAAISAPSTCAHMLTEAAGTGLSAAAIRVRAKALGEVELPQPSADWDRGAAAAKRAHDAWGRASVDEYETALQDLAVAMVAAYGADSGLVAWWMSRRTKRSTSIRAY